VKTFPAIGKKRWEAELVNMTADAWPSILPMLEAHKPFRDMELCADETGKKIWISISGEPVFDSAGTFRGYAASARTSPSASRTRSASIPRQSRRAHVASEPGMFNRCAQPRDPDAHRYNRNFAVLFIDLDRFKNIKTPSATRRATSPAGNGHAPHQTVRASDVVARLGGDEFVVLVQEVTEPKQVAAVARKILSALVHPISIQGQECRLTASIGICIVSV